MRRHAFLHQLAEELREVYKEKCESMVPKHNEEEQSQDKRKASKRYQCQVGMCKRNKTTENCYISNMYVGNARKLWKINCTARNARCNTIKDFIRCQ
jgi:hypothetical protein